MYKKDLALNNLQMLICHKYKSNQTKVNCSIGYEEILNRSILPIDETLTDTSTADQSEPGSNDNEVWGQHSSDLLS